MKVKLHITSSSKAGKEVPLKRGTYLIGRSKECSLRASSDLVSRRHCELIVELESVIIRDLGSKNGTLVNGERIDEPRALESGDKLQIGPMKFEIVVEAAAGSVAADTTSGEQEVTVAEGAAPNSAAAADVESAPVPEVVATQGDGDYDADISDWLDDDQPSMDEPAIDEPAAADTDVPAVDETRAVDKPLPHATPTDSDASQPGVDEAAKSPTGETKPGKLPSVSKEPSPDSGQAAADVLRNFSRRK